MTDKVNNDFIDANFKVDNPSSQIPFYQNLHIDSDSYGR